MHLIVNKMGEFLRDELLANLYQQGGDTVMANISESVKE